jgi:hypothetical protein
MPQNRPGERQNEDEHGQRAQQRGQLRKTRRHELQLPAIQEPHHEREPERDRDHRKRRVAAGEAQGGFGLRGHEENGSAFGDALLKEHLEKQQR